MITDEKLKFIIELYQNGITQKEISQTLGCSQSTISANLKKGGVKCRDREEVFKNQKYYDINKIFFEKIDNETNAYFLGFLYADGCVQIKNNCYTTTLKLHSDDKIILEKFRDIMSPSSSIKSTDGGKYSYFRIHQKEICEQLISHGCVPNKSLILKFPTTVPNELMRHFLRGYSDGDGSIYYTKPRNKTHKSFIWKIISTKQFCESVKIFLKNELNINCSLSLSNPKTNKITTTLVIGGNLQVRKVLDFLYQDATIYLPRKHEKYLELINYQSGKSNKL